MNNTGHLIGVLRLPPGSPCSPSQVAESHIDALINARHKRTKKMQWTRGGAHHVLQIRAMMANGEWESKRQDEVL